MTRPQGAPTARKQSHKTRWVDLLRGQLNVYEIVAPALVEEHRFLDERKFRFDFALPELRIGIEVEGGVFAQASQTVTYVGGQLRRHSRGSRHTSGAGFQEDCFKYNAAAIAGWLVLRFTSNQITSGLAVRMIRDAIAARRKS